MTNSFPPEQLFREAAEVWKNDKTAETGFISFEQRGGAWCTNAANTLMGKRDSVWDLVIFAGFKDPEAQEAKIGMFREYQQRFKTCSPSLQEVQLPNFHLKDSITEHENVRELRHLKEKFDPHSLFSNVFGL